MLKLVDHKLWDSTKPVTFIESPNQSDTFDPIGIIMHDTAGFMGPVEDTLNYFAREDARVSAHFTIDREGKIGQSVRCDKKAWHAGQSSYHGRKYCNGFTFGIELVNPGRMTKPSGYEPHTYQAWWGELYQVSAGNGYAIEHASTTEHGAGYWMDYTEAQLLSAANLCKLLVNHYTLQFITTHWFVSPGRKFDTNPLFPMARIRSAAFSRDADEETVNSFDGQAIVDANLRQWPSRKSKKVGTLHAFQGVDVVRSGFWDHDGFGTEQWHLVTTPDAQGWVWATLIDLY